MQTIRQGRPRTQRDPETINSISFSVKISPELLGRIERYLSSPLSSVKSKRELFEASIIEYLDRDEVMVKELEKAREKIKKRIEIKIFRDYQDE